MDAPQPAAGSASCASATIIVPAFNEERFIARQLAQVSGFVRHMGVEIIVVDNNSTDRTVELARSAGADNVISTAGTVAAMRNRGAALARGDVFIFMDADVFPTEAWAARLPMALQGVAKEPMLVTGSWVCVPDKGTWIEEHWFKPLEAGSSSHINSGHMIVSRTLFERLGGFDERLRTGEDFDFSVRARSMGGRIFDDASLRVIHEGYPKTLREFVRREMWHGVGDCRTLRIFLASKIAVIGAAMLHVQVLGALLSILSGSAVFAGWAVAGSLAMSAAAAFVRYRRAPLSSRMMNTFLYYVYFNARGLSPYAALLRLGGKKPAGASRH